VTVVDSSAIVDLLLGAGVAREVERMFEQEGELAAPDLLVFEVLAVLRREAARELREDRAAGAVRDLGDVALALFPSLVLRERAWALRQNFTIADALFIALAEQLDEPLATKDAPLAEEAGKHTAARVFVLGRTVQQASTGGPRDLGPTGSPCPGVGSIIERVSSTAIGGLRRV
jgi:predicted nucleic acid-binding protein